MAGNSATDDGAEGIDPYVDAADRLERVIDTQIATIEGIDTKAEHVTRLVAILLGAVLSLVSVSVQFDGFEAGALPGPVVLLGATGVVSLVLAMAGAIVTYLSSEFKMGLHPGVGRLLSRPEHRTTPGRHVRRVLGTYGHAIEQNRRVIDTNSARFRWTLVFLLDGVSLLSLGTLIFVSGVRGTDAWVGVGCAGVVLVASARYILTGSYLTLEEQ